MSAPAVGAAVGQKLQLAIGERVLDRGLTLLAVQNPGVQTFACSVLLDVDLRDERRGEDGLANLVGDCLDEGTTRRGNTALAAAVESLGAALEGHASGGRVQCPAENAGKALALLVEMLTQPAFGAREVARVKAEILNEIRADEEEPRTVAALRFRAEVYGAHPYGRPGRGTARTVRAFAPAQLRAFHARGFVAPGGIVAAAGPEPVARTLDLLEHAFRSLKGRTIDHPPVPAPRPAGARRDVHLPMPREQVHVFLGHLGIKRTHPDYYALSVMDHVLGTGPGFTSRIQRRLRDEQGLCYTVNASISAGAGEEVGTFSAYIGTSPEHRQRAIDGFLEEIERLRAEPPSEAEVRDVHDYLTGSFVFGLERNASLAAFATRVKKFDLGFDYLQRYPALIRAVTPAEVHRVACQHLHPDAMMVVSAGAG